MTPNELPNHCPTCWPGIQRIRPAADLPGCCLRHIFYHGEVRIYWQDSAFEKSADKTYQVLLNLAPKLWHQGKTYPNCSYQLHQLLSHEL